MRLNNYLKYSGKTHKDFADDLGLSVSAVHKWLYGQRFPRREHLEKIKELTKGEVTANDFIFK